MEIITKRLLLAEWSDSETKELSTLMNNIEISKNLLSVPFPYTSKDATDWISYSKNESKRSPRKNYNFALKLKSGNLIGGIALQVIDFENKIGEVNFWLGQKFWRKGYMSEALSELINFAFVNLKLNRINYYIFSENNASRELAKKLGFNHLETQNKSVKCRADGKVKDNEIYVLDFNAR